MTVFYKNIDFLLLLNLREKQTVIIKLLERFIRISLYLSDYKNDFAGFDAELHIQCFILI